MSNNHTLVANEEDDDAKDQRERGEMHVTDDSDKKMTSDTRKLSCDKTMESHTLKRLPNTRFTVLHLLHLSCLPFVAPASTSTSKSAPPSVTDLAMLIQSNPVS